MKIDLINDLYNDSWNFHLVLFGIGLSIFTLLYSFILTKRDELKLLSELFKSGDKSPLNFQKEFFAKEYIKTLKKLNDKIVVVSIITFIQFIFNWFFERFIDNNLYNLKKYGLVISFTLTLLTITYLFKILFVIYMRYKSETKI